MPLLKDCIHEIYTSIYWKTCLTISEPYDQARALELVQRNSEAFQLLGSLIAVLGYLNLGNVTLNNYLLTATQDNDVTVAGVTSVKKTVLVLWW